MNPSSISTTEIPDQKSSIMKQPLTIIKNTPIMNSNTRILAYCNIKNAKVSRAVMITPQTSGIPNNKFNAYAVPRTSYIITMSFIQIYYQITYRYVRSNNTDFSPKLNELISLPMFFIFVHHPEEYI